MTKLAVQYLKISEKKPNNYKRTQRRKAVRERKRLESLDYLRRNQFVECKDSSDYYVSKHGEVYSLKSNCKLKPHLLGRGYFYVHINNKTKLVHRLVADAFCEGKSEVNKTVNHIDGNKINNHFSNLEWCSYRYNEQDKRKRLGKSGHGETNPMAKLDKQSVSTIRNLCASGLYGQKDIGRMFKIKQSTVSNIYRNKTWK